MIRGFEGCRCACGPQRPDHEQRLEQQPNAAGEVRVEPESICMRDELVDVAGNTTTKKTATTHPTGARHLFSSTRLAPIAISTTPEAVMTKSAFNGSHGGTWARKAVRAKLR